MRRCARGSEWSAAASYSLLSASQFTMAVLRWLLPLVWLSCLALRLAAVVQAGGVWGRGAACDLSSQQVKRSAALRGAQSTIMWQAMSSMVLSTRVRISPWRASSPSAGAVATVGTSDRQCQPSSICALPVRR